MNYDADIYSSTLFTLARMELLRKPYIALFDEFTGPETLATYNYLKTFAAKIEMMGKMTIHGYLNSSCAGSCPTGVERLAVSG